ncbi:hypothetical protein CaCOL14_008202 [Colletotrichum acutatum]
MPFHAFPSRLLTASRPPTIRLPHTRNPLLRSKKWFTNTCSAVHPAVPTLTRTPSSSNQFDVLVVGAGASGVTTAALLAEKGYSTLIVEAKERIGGRASTRSVDGFLINTGALVIEFDGAVSATYQALGLQLNLHEPGRGATVIRWGNRDINVVEGIFGLLRNAGPRVLAIMLWSLPWLRPKKNESTRSWLSRFTHNSTIHDLADNVLGSIFAARGDVVLAEVFLYYFLKDTSFKKIGLPPGGTIEVWKPLARHMQASGGQVWLNSTVSKLLTEPDGSISGALVKDGSGREIKVFSKVIVSSIGPHGTALLAGTDVLPADYTETLQRWNKPAAISTIHFASRKPLATFPCLAMFSKTRRLVYAGNFSAPELNRCPKGWHLYSGASVPIPAIGSFDLEKEKSLLIQDLRVNFPGFDEAKILAIDVTADEWPAQRAVSGYDQPQTTPFPNLFNVGDGTKPWASGGTAACSRSGQLVAELISKQFPLKM